ncbi:hypothetical protein K438DRAFT_1990980 [Mycena galopus ATCC 62051]|nr:hypothetical protein K438DRAFT_1990980 [Mycena galopus ATCC 62051]
MSTHLAGPLLEDAFGGLNINYQPIFYPSKGCESWYGSENHAFYVVTRGHVPGIYTHWLEASKQVSGFPHCAHKKHWGWTAATAAWDSAHRPSATGPLISVPTRPITPPPKTDTRVQRARRLEKTPTSARKAMSSRDAVSAPFTPTGSGKNKQNKPILYVYSRGEDTTIYADQTQASSAVRRGLADGSFRKVEVTPRVSRAFDHATESALEVLNISDFSDIE